MVVRLRLVVSLPALAAACALAAAPAGTARPQQPQASASTSLASQVAAQLNIARVRRGLVALRVSPELTAAAARHSREMARNGYFEHRSADGSAFWKRIARYYPAGRHRFWSVGENLLWSSPTIDAQSALRRWMESPAHRRNMLDARWREVGISALHVSTAPGFFQGLDVTLVTADFGVRI